jgi:hypothetical protein
LNHKQCATAIKKIKTSNHIFPCLKLEREERALASSEKVGDVSIHKQHQRAQSYTIEGHLCHNLLELLLIQKVCIYMKIIMRSKHINTFEDIILTPENIVGNPIVIAILSFVPSSLMILSSL